MGLFSKEACEFCQKEVGMLKRSKLSTKEYICNECKLKTNYFARMSYCSKDDVLRMMNTLGQQAAAFEASFDAAEGRFAAAERHFNTWNLGRYRVQYRCNTTLGAFQLLLDDMDHYESIPVLWFSQMIPYEFKSPNAVLDDMRRSDIMNTNVDYVEVEEVEDDDGKVIHCTLTFPYDDQCIREVRIESDVNEDQCAAFKDLANQINSDRKVWISKGEFDAQRKNEMQIRNLGDTAAAIVNAAMKGEDVKEAIKKGVETANDIEEGKVKQGFFGKLFRK